MSYAKYLPTRNWDIANTYVAPAGGVDIVFSCPDEAFTTTAAVAYTTTDDSNIPALGVNEATKKPMNTPGFIRLLPNERIWFAASGGGVLPRITVET